MVGPAALHLFFQRGHCSGGGLQFSLEPGHPLPANEDFHLATQGLSDRIPHPPAAGPSSDAHPPVTEGVQTSHRRQPLSA